MQRINPVLVAFVCAWLGYFSLIVVLPVEYRSVELGSALLVQMIFVLAVVAAIVGLEAVRRPATAGPAKQRRVSAPPLNVSELNRIVMMGVGLSAVGIALLVYVRLAVQGIDYSRGIAIARQLWRVEGEERGGISSPLSIPGYGLGFFFYASTFLGHLHWEHLKARTRRILVTGSLLFVAMHSILSGGRTVLLVLIISVMSTGLIRKLQRKKSFPGKFWRNIILGIFFLLASLSYVIYVFSERASANGISPEIYATGTLHALGATPTDSFRMISSFPEPFAAVANLGVIAGAYVTHSIGTVASVMEYQSHQGAATFIGVRELLTRLGAVPASDESWILSGAFLSLPGAFWYDFGLVGVIVVGLLLGAALFMARQIVLGSIGGGITMAFAVAALTTAFLSPLILAADSLAFPFMLMGYGGLAAYSWFAYGPRNWWDVGLNCSLTLKRLRDVSSDLDRASA
jgi:uncharacterized membrane protein (UPF0136 family)